MLSLIIGILISFSIIFLCIKIEKGQGLSILLFSIIIGFSFYIAIVSTVSGYTDWEKKDETPLISLTSSVETENNIYVLRANGQYNYRYEIDSNFDTETSREYKIAVISSKNVEEVEDQNCKEPMLYIYTRKGKKSIWTFAFGTTETKYVFYVPEGTIQEKIE